MLTDRSAFAAVVLVVAGAGDAGEQVTLSSTSLAADCAALTWHTPTRTSTSAPSVVVTLDNDGAALALLFGAGCGPTTGSVQGSPSSSPSSVVSAPLMLKAARQTSSSFTAALRPASETETAALDEATIVSVEESHVWAGSPTSVSSAALNARCAGGLTWFTTTGSTASGSTVATALDGFGNAYVGLLGKDCAAGTARVQADLDAAPYSTASAVFRTTTP